MTSDTENENKSKETDFPDEWMIRPCKAYVVEYKDCRSIKARLHQHFIYGHSIDCSQWKRDYDNCLKWVENRNRNAGNELVKSETARRLERLKGHYANNVWEKRKSPPQDWNKPLPDYLQKEYENTFLNLKAKELRGEEISDIDKHLSNFTPSCSIL